MTSPTVRPRPAPRHVTRTVIGYPDEIARIIATNRANGRLVATSGPVNAPGDDGRIIVQLRLRVYARPEATRPEVAGRPAQARQVARLRLRRQRPRRQRSVFEVVCLVLGASIATGVLLYTVVLRLIAAAIAALWSLLAARVDLLVGVGFVVLVLGAAVVKRCVCPTCGRP